MEQKTRSFGQSGTIAIWGILGTFILAAVLLVSWQLRDDFMELQQVNQARTADTSAWEGLEQFFARTQHCSGFLQGRKLGETLLTQFPGAPVIGRPWGKAGHVVKDLYLLRREDEVAWQVRDQLEWDGLTGEGIIYLKVSLVKLAEGEEASVDELLHRTAVSRIFGLRVSMAREQVYADCDPQKAKEACEQAGFEMGAVPRMKLIRAPASQANQCDGQAPQAMACVLPGDHFPITRCI